MSELFGELLKAQPDILLMLAGLVLIGIGVVGSVKSYIDPGKWGRIGALGIGVILLTVGVTLHARELAAMARKAISPDNPGPMSSICTFDAGPLAGATAELPETQIAAIGSPCHDATGNKGYLVAPDTPLSSHNAHRDPAEPTHTIKAAAAPQPATPISPAPAANPTPAPTEALSRICTFNAGPLSGATHELPRAKPQTIGQPCHDLRGNSGLIVAPNTLITP